MHWVYELRVPDHTRSIPTEKSCAQIVLIPLDKIKRQFPSVLICTRRKNHTGRHAEGNKRHIIAVWGSQEERVQ